MNVVVFVAGRSLSRRGHKLQTVCNQAMRISSIVLRLAVLQLFAGPCRDLRAQKGAEAIDDITGKYHFLTADDTLAILEEEGELHGYIDVYQSEDESDAILSYPITTGSRKGDHVEIKTGKIHQRYYRFEGKVERGAGHTPKDPDYLRLIGDLEIVTVRGDSGSEAVARRRVIFKSMGRRESPDDERDR